MFTVEAIGCTIIPHVNIIPYNNMEKVIGILPLGGRFSVDFDQKTFVGHSRIKWGGVLHEYLKMAKINKTINSLRSQGYGDYEVVIENKFFWNGTKYEIIFDRNYHNNGKKGKFTVKTGSESTYLACDDAMKEVINQMAWEIGYPDSKKHCDYSARLADDI
jgi:hypothetical protein